VDTCIVFLRGAAEVAECRAASAGDNCLLFGALGSREISRGIAGDDTDGTKYVIA